MVIDRWEESGSGIGEVGVRLGIEGFKALMLCRGLGGVREIGLCDGFL